MRFALFAAALTIAAVLAGCAGTPSETSTSSSSPPPPAPPAYAFAPPVVVAEDRKEPSIAAAPDGTLWYTAIAGAPTESPVWKSSDHGKTWTQIDVQPTGGMAPERLGFGGGDTDLAVDGAGRIGVSDLWAGGAAFYLSADGGKTWSGTFSHGIPYEDRNWITATNTTFYHIGRVFFPGVATWATELADLGEASPAAGSPWLPKGVVWSDEGIQNGNFAADLVDGTLYVPYTVAGGIRLAASTDGATTWASHDVVSGSGDVRYVFTPAAVDFGHNVYVAWVDSGKHAYYAVSRDHGVTFGKPVEVSAPGYHTFVFPWVTAGSDGRIAVSYLASNSTKGDPQAVSSTWDMISAFVTGAANATTAQAHYAVAMTGVHKNDISVGGLGGGADRSLGDFFETALDPSDGALVLGFASGNAGGIQDVFVRQSEGPGLLAGKTVGAFSGAPT